MINMNCSNALTNNKMKNKTERRTKLIAESLVLTRSGYDQISARIQTF